MAELSGGRSEGGYAREVPVSSHGGGEAQGKAPPDDLGPVILEDGSGVISGRSESGAIAQFFAQ